MALPPRPAFGSFTAGDADRVCARPRGILTARASPSSGSVPALLRAGRWTEGQDPDSRGSFVDGYEGAGPESDPLLLEHRQQPW